MEDSAVFNKINRELVDQLRIRGFTWKDVCSEMGVSTSAIYQWRNRLHDPYVEPKLPLTNNELDAIVMPYLRDNPSRGEAMTWGHVRSLGAHVTRQQLRDSIERVDPGGRALRRSVAVQRVVYNVAGPHHLWHIDGCHKLIMYGIVVHGGIDGFSRAAMFLRASDNNRASTVLELFIEATRLVGGIPSRVRSDHGGENVEVARYMLEHHGSGRGSMLTGTSMRNQRIERLWRDCTSNVLSLYRRFFKELEINHGITFNIDAVRFIMHHLFMERINQDLQQFVQSWNSHSLSSTDGNLTPAQLLFRYRHLASLMQTPAQVNENDYGVDAEEGGLQESDGEEPDDQEGAVVVPSTPCPLSPDRKVEFCSRVAPLKLTDPKSVFLQRILEAMAVMEELLA